MIITEKNEAEIVAIEHTLEALKEARHILTTNPVSKYGPHYLEHPAYAEILRHIDTKIDLTKQALDLWSSACISH